MHTEAHYSFDSVEQVPVPYAALTVKVHGVRAFVGRMAPLEDEVILAYATAAAGQRLDREGWEERPTWRGLVGGQSPPSDGNEPGLGASGWQRHAALALDTTFREQVVLPTANPSARAMLRSQSGSHAGVWLSAIPADAAATLAPDLMHPALRRRLRFPLPITRARCGWDGQHGCRGVVDALGDCPTSCPRTGVLARRGFVFERAWVQVAQKAERFLNNGLPTPQRPVWRRRTAAAWTALCTAPHRTGSPCAATRRWCPP